VAHCVQVTQNHLVTLLLLLLLWMELGLLLTLLGLLLSLERCRG
jgi:hypothetical protein